MLNVIREQLGGLNSDKKTLLGLSIVLMSLVSISYSTIPLLFNRPQFQCTSANGSLFNCPEKDACRQKELKYYYEYSFTSVSKQYNLYCEDKVVETNILTLVMFSHFLGTAFNIVVSRIGNDLRKILLLLGMASGIVGASIISLLFIEGTVFVCIALMAWAFCTEIILCYLHVVPSLAFKPIKQKVLGIQILCIPISSIFVPFFFWFFEDWKIALVVTVGVPHIIFGYMLLSKLEKFLEGVNQVHPLIQDLLRESAKLQQQAPPTFLQVLKSPHAKNFIIFLFLYSCGYVSLFSSTLYLNTVSWNLYLNIAIVNSFQVVANAVGLYVNNNMDRRKFLKFIFVSITTLYLLYTFLPLPLQFVIIILGKGLTDFIWILLCLEMLKIFPTNYVAFASACKSSFSLAITSVLPYVKYGMQNIGLSMFPVSGLYYLAGTICSEKMKPIERQQQKSEVEIQMN